MGEPDGPRRPLGRGELVALLERHGLRPSRALGQNFLVDPNVAERIVRLSGVGPEAKVVEIGAGLGSLTLALAAAGARVVAVEIDRRLLPLLSDVVSAAGVEVLEEDALTLGWAGALEGSGWHLVANLPYNIATPLVLEVLEKVPAVAQLLVMVQREVAERLAARPGSKAYGAVSVRAAYFATARLSGYVPASVFVPRPKVESALLQLARRPEPAVSHQVASYEEINLLVGLGFSGRRKMLRRSLAGRVSEESFARAGISPTSRPEELSIEEWGRLAAAVRQGEER